MNERPTVDITDYIGKHLPAERLYMIATIPFIVGAIVAVIMMPMFAQYMRTVGPGR